MEEPPLDWEIGQEESETEAGAGVLDWLIPGAKAEEGPDMARYNVSTQEERLETDQAK
jgi:hypothetical protein